MTKLSEQEKQDIVQKLRLTTWTEAGISKLIESILTIDRASRPASVSRETLEKLRSDCADEADREICIMGQQYIRQNTEVARQRIKSVILATPLPPIEPPAVSREQDTDKLLADLRERCAKASGEVVAAYGGNCVSNTHRHILTVPLHAPVKPVWEHKPGCPTPYQWDVDGKYFVHVNNEPSYFWRCRATALFCDGCGAAKPVVGQGEAR